MLHRVGSQMKDWAGVIALFLVLGGGSAYAAATIGSAEIDDNSVASVDLRDNDVRGVDVRDATLTGADINEGSLSVVQGRGTLLSNRRVFTPTPLGGAGKRLLLIPGLGELTAFCYSDYAKVFWTNNSNVTVDLWRENLNNSATDDDDWRSSLVPPSSTEWQVVNSDYNPGARVALGTGNDPGARQVATINVFAMQQGVNAPCGFQAQGTLWATN